MPVNRIPLPRIVVEPAPKELNRAASSKGHDVAPAEEPPAQKRTRAVSDPVPVKKPAAKKPAAKKPVAKKPAAKPAAKKPVAKKPAAKPAAKKPAAKKPSAKKA